MRQTSLRTVGTLSDDLLESTIRLFRMISRLWSVITVNSTQPDATGCAILLEQRYAPTGSAILTTGQLGDNELDVIELATASVAACRSSQASGQLSDSTPPRGRAIVTGTLIIGVATQVDGETIDEAFALCLAVALNLLNRNQADEIATRRKTPGYAKLRSQFER